ncbi:hypothetical protein VN97_g4539 [Penicillium thymicola]|uniref:Uncharacterized protein n=1 Tax=Penicillium thymicola TaxID=293382 RepID=A0AAI9TLN2_PENTH|nr:hypothetical protein VN97_g4539 [Penicillium thymicola]
MVLNVVQGGCKVGFKVVVKMVVKVDGCQGGWLSRWLFKMDGCQGGCSRWMVVKVVVQDGWLFKMDGCSRWMVVKMDGSQDGSQGGWLSRWLFKVDGCQGGWLSRWMVVKVVGCQDESLLVNDDCYGWLRQVVIKCMVKIEEIFW